MSTTIQRRGHRGLALLEVHLRSLDCGPPPARERLDTALGDELAHKLVFALSGTHPAPLSRRAA